MRRETSAGGVVVRRFADGPRYLLIRDGYGNWGFPKGKLERGESPADAARREVGEETGLERLIPRADLPTIRWTHHRDGHDVRKQCHFFLYESECGEPRPQAEEAIDACRWCRPAEVRDTLTFANARTVFEAAARIVDRADRVGARPESE